MHYSAIPRVVALHEQIHLHIGNSIYLNKVQPKACHCINVVLYAKLLLCPMRKVLYSMCIFVTRALGLRICWHKRSLTCSYNIKREIKTGGTSSQVAEWCLRLAMSSLYEITQSPALETMRLIARKMLYVRYVGLCLQGLKFSTDQMLYGMPLETVSVDMQSSQSTTCLQGGHCLPQTAKR